jgi:hypothetical protein
VASRLARAVDQTASVAAALLAGGSLALAEPGAAEITVGNRSAELDTSVAVDVNDDGTVEADEILVENVVRIDFDSVAESLSTNLGPGLSTATQSTSFSNDGERLSVQTSHRCSNQMAAPKRGDEQPGRSAISHSRVLLGFHLTERARFSFSASGSTRPGPSKLGAGNVANFGLTQIGNPEVDFFFDVQDGGKRGDGPIGPPSVSFEESGILEPGDYHIGGACGSGAPRGSGESGKFVFDSSTGGSEFRMSLTLEPEEPADVVRWVGGREGSFGDVENWDPPQVPDFIEGEREQTALFDRGRAVDVDLGAVAAASGPRGPAGTRRLKRLDLKGVDLRPRPGGLFDLRDTSRVLPSLEVREGGSLVLDGASVSAQTIRLRDTGQLVLPNDSGFLDFDVLGSDPGTRFAVEGGGTATAEVVVTQGVLLVDGAGSELRTTTLSTLSPGSLRVSNGARLEAQTCEPMAADRMTVAGGDAGPATWIAGNFEQGRGTTEALPGGLFAAVDVVLNGPSPTLLVDGGRVEVATDLLVGLSSSPDTGALLQIGGPRNLGGELSVLGDLEIQNGSAVIRELPVAGLTPSSQNLFVTGGALLLFPGGRLRTEANAEVGVLGPGIAEIGVAGAPPVASSTAWTVLGSLSVGPEALGVGKLRLFNASVEAGTVQVGRFGSIEGLGLLRLTTAPPFSGDGIVHNRGIIHAGITIDGAIQNAPDAVVERRASSAGALPQLNPLAAALPAVVRRARGGEPPPPETPLSVIGDAALDGTLVLQFRNGFAPAQGELLQVLEVGGNATGDFAQIVVQGLAPGAEFDGGFEDGAYTVAALTDTQALPLVALKAKNKLKESKKGGAKLKVLRSGDRSQPLAVDYALGGSAVHGIDYRLLEGTVEIPAGRKSATIQIQPLLDGATEPPETIEIELLPGDGYSLPLASRATIELLSQD